MTRTRAYGRDVAFMAWLREQGALDSRDARISVSDVDVLIHQYRDRASSDRLRRLDNIMVLETKTHQRGPCHLPFAQDDSYSIWNAALRSLGIGKDGKRRPLKFTINGELRLVRVWGAHILSMSGDRPENSELMWWNANEAPITVAILLELLRFERDPYNHIKRLDQRDHHAGERINKPLLRLVNEKAS